MAENCRNARRPVLFFLKKTKKMPRIVRLHHALRGVSGYLMIRDGIEDDSSLERGTQNKELAPIIEAR